MAFVAKCLYSNAVQKQLLLNTLFLSKTVSRRMLLIVKLPRWICPNILSETFSMVIIRKRFVFFTGRRVSPADASQSFWLKRPFQRSCDLMCDEASLPIRVTNKHLTGAAERQELRLFSFLTPGSADMGEAGYCDWCLWQLAVRRRQKAVPCQNGE